MPAPAFARFLALAKRGTPRATFEPPPGQDRTAAEQAYQRGDIERSINYCKDVLGSWASRGVRLLVGPVVRPH